jgi:hypothetical protein
MSEPFSRREWAGLILFSMMILGAIAYVCMETDWSIYLPTPNKVFNATPLSQNDRIEKKLDKILWRLEDQK